MSVDAKSAEPPVPTTAHVISQLQSEIPLPMMLCYFISNSFEAVPLSRAIKNALNAGGTSYIA